MAAEPSPKPPTWERGLPPAGQEVFCCKQGLIRQKTHLAIC